MNGRHIYVDIDDVLAETVERLVELLEHLHGRLVDPRAVEHFDLSKSFGLDPVEIEAFMEHVHTDRVIESIAPIRGAASVLERWQAAGHRITLVTGRPPSTNAASRRWLETHDLRHESLHHLDKWSRPSWNRDGLPALRFEEIPAFGFDHAVEDSLDTAIRLVEEFAIPVALMDRPWNRDVGALPQSTRASLVRCRDWSEVARAIDSF